MITMYSQVYFFVNWSVKLADTYNQITIILPAKWNKLQKHLISYKSIVCGRSLFSRMATIQSHLLSINDYCHFSQHNDQTKRITSRTISAPCRMLSLVMHSVASLKWGKFCLPIANLHNTCLPTLHKSTEDLPLLQGSQAGHVIASGQSYRMY